MTEATTEVWKIEGMSCGGCSGSVERALAGAPGLLRAKADHAAGQVVLELGAGADRDEVAARIERAGFDVVARG